MRFKLRTGDPSALPGSGMTLFGILDRLNHRRIVDLIRQVTRATGLQGKNLKTQGLP